MASPLLTPATAPQPRITPEAGPQCSLASSSPASASSLTSARPGTAASGGSMTRSTGGVTAADAASGKENMKEG